MRRKFNVSILKDFSKHNAQRQLVVGNVYTFDQLTPEEEQDVYGNAPKGMERDEDGQADPYAWQSFLDDLENGRYKFVLEELSVQELLDLYGDDPELLRQDEKVNELIADISQNGMKNIPVGTEGHHRAGAHILMGKPMLHFRIEE